LQILTIEELLEKRIQLDYPSGGVNVTFKKARRVIPSETQQELSN
jgi:hypothetical protein